MERTDAASLLRTIAGAEETLRKLPVRGDEDAVEEWASAVARLGHALSALERWDDVAERLSELELVLDTLGPSLEALMSVRVIRAAALLGQSRFEESLQLTDEMLTIYEQRCMTTGVTPYGATEAELESLRPSSGQSDLSADAKMNRLKEITQAGYAHLSLTPKAQSLRLLGRLDEAYDVASQLVMLASLGAFKAGTVDDALRLRGRIAFQQRRYDRMIGALLRLSRRQFRAEYERRMAEADR